jgi:hypothetical protein
VGGGCERIRVMSTNRRKQQAPKRATKERAAELFVQGRSPGRGRPSSWTSRARAPAAGIRAGKPTAPRHYGITALRTRGPTGRRPKISDAALEPISRARRMCSVMPRPGPRLGVGWYDVPSLVSRRRPCTGQRRPGPGSRHLPRRAHRRSRVRRQWRSWPTMLPHR